jgi:hypothetical protein
MGVTSAEGKGVIILGWYFIPVFEGFDEAVESGGLDLLVILLHEPMDLAVETAKTLAQLGVEVVLDAVVGPGWGIWYLPGRLLAISFHLFPSSSCSENNSYY